jgi:hypothetical protein
VHDGGDGADVSQASAIMGDWMQGVMLSIIVVGVFLAITAIREYMMRLEFDQLHNPALLRPLPQNPNNNVPVNNINVNHDNNNNNNNNNWMADHHIHLGNNNVNNAEVRHYQEAANHANRGHHTPRTRGAHHHNITATFGHANASVDPNTIANVGSQGHTASAAAYSYMQEYAHDVEIFAKRTATATAAGQMHLAHAGRSRSDDSQAAHRHEAIGGFLSEASAYARACAESQGSLLTDVHACAHGKGEEGVQDAQTAAAAAAESTSVAVGNYAEKERSGILRRRKRRHRDSDVTVEGEMSASAYAGPRPQVFIHVRMHSFVNFTHEYFQ